MCYHTYSSPFTILQPTNHDNKTDNNLQQRSFDGGHCPFEHYTICYITHQCHMSSCNKRNAGFQFSCISSQVPQNIGCRIHFHFLQALNHSIAPKDMDIYLWYHGIYKYPRWDGHGICDRVNQLCSEQVKQCVVGIMI